MCMEDLLAIKQRFEIIGNNPGLNRAIDVATQVAPTDLSVLVIGESGVGKEIFPRIIHAYSARKHAPYIAVNCGAIPEGTIDSELFGHEKGAFTGAISDRKGYFEVTDGGTIFLDEVGELPLATQSRLLRVLESGEFIRVGSSKVQKTNVRVIAATNLNIPNAVKNGKFREDLYYRLNAIPINVPPLRERPEDTPLLFRKFAVDFAEKYRMPAIRLTEDAVTVLQQFRWPGNIRQLKNVTEQISIIEQERSVDVLTLRKYIPDNDPMLPTLTSNHDKGDTSFASEREILYKILFDMKKDMNDLKRLVYDLMQHDGNHEKVTEAGTSLVLRNLYEDKGAVFPSISTPIVDHSEEAIQETEAVIEESFSIEEKEKELILKALEKNRGKRKIAAQDLGISERTLYRKLKEYDLENEVR
ncbi:MAG: sigma-54 dependent transcriptional regulator [Odoribacter sp.]